MKLSFAVLTVSILFLSLWSNLCFAQDDATTQAQPDDTDNQQPAKDKVTTNQESGSGPKINCFKCRSDKDPKCTSASPSGPATIQSNCSNPNKLIHEWFQSQSLQSFGLPDVNLEPVIAEAGKQVNSAADLKIFAACVYFVATTENEHTKGVDKHISYVRNVFGDKNANNSVAVQEYVFRDCAELRMREEVKEKGDHCVTIPNSNQNLPVRVHMCTCITDKCNEGEKSMGELIARSLNTESTGYRTGRNLGEIIIITIVNFLICKTIFAGKYSS